MCEQVSYPTVGCNAMTMEGLQSQGYIIISMEGMQSPARK